MRPAQTLRTPLPWPASPLPGPNHPPEQPPLAWCPAAASSGPHFASQPLASPPVAPLPLASARFEKPAPAAAQPVLSQPPTAPSSAQSAAAALPAPHPPAAASTATPSPPGLYRAASSPFPASKPPPPAPEGPSKSRGRGAHPRERATRDQPTPRTSLRLWTTRISVPQDRTMTCGWRAGLVEI